MTTPTPTTQRLEKIWRILPEEAQDALHEDHLERLLRLQEEAHAPSMDLKQTVWDFMRCVRQLRKFRQMTFAPQRSNEWLELRKNLLTASDLASALGKGKFTTRPKLLQSKAEARAAKSAAPMPPPETPGAPKPFKSPALSWGTMFEPMIARIYSEMNDDITLYEFGLIQHPILKCFGASPDGITEFGKMLEIKCPWKRVIKQGDVPEQYYLQIQGQLSVCQLDHCDYIEVVMDDIPDEQTYYERVPEDATHAHGVIIEFQTPDDMNRDTQSYEYSPPKLTPKKAYQWANTFARSKMAEPDIHITRIRPWKMNDMNLVPVRFDPILWETLVPQIQHFWNEVEEKTHQLSQPPSPSPSMPSQPAPATTRPRKTVKYTYRDDTNEDTFY